MDLEALKADLARDEGEVSHAYTDSLGYLTIGIGRLIDKRRGGGISHDEALVLLGNDIAAVTAELDDRLPWWRHLDEPRSRALANMAYNLGAPTLCQFQDMLGALEHRDWQTAHDEALDSRWAQQVGDRAVRIATTFLTGEG